MAESDPQRVTRLVGELSAPDGENAANQLMPVVYNELRALAYRYFRDERPNHTLQPTALVHEAYLRLVDQTQVDWKGRAHFFGIAARAMRRVLVDYARERKRQKRGGDRQRLPLDSNLVPTDLPDSDVLALHEGIERLAALDERQARVVELRFFGGLSIEEVAAVLDTSKRTIEGDWTHAKAWLRAELERGNLE
jgi:RNA polymerase sigma factor (TIGR02999 family)